MEMRQAGNGLHGASAAKTLSRKFNSRLVDDYQKRTMLLPNAAFDPAQTQSRRS